MSLAYEDFIPWIEQVADNWSDTQTEQLAVASERSRLRHHKPYVDVSNIVRAELSERSSALKHQRQLRDGPGMDFVLGIPLRHMSHALQSAAHSNISLESATEQLAAYYGSGNSDLVHLASYSNYVTTPQEHNMHLLPNSDRVCYFDPRFSRYFDWSNGELHIRGIRRDLDEAQASLEYRISNGEEVLNRNGSLVRPNGECPAKLYIPRVATALFRICTKDPLLAQQTFNQSAEPSLL